jgi:hypothetical protein
MQRKAHNKRAKIFCSFSDTFQHIGDLFDRKFSALQNYDLRFSNKFFLSTEILKDQQLLNRITEIFDRLQAFVDLRKHMLVRTSVNRKVFDINA